tara:strand:- start:261 stop:635 length:375 start_codon:yes stop_codon:yes gene_type:complete
MRVIDSKISAMILKGLKKEKFDRKLSKRDRVVSDGTGKVSVFLWKTEIAEFDPYVNEIIVKDGGHQTVTTKSRINAMLSGWAQGNPGISQRKWVWYIDEVCPLTRDRKSKEFQGVAAFPLKIWK